MASIRIGLECTLGKLRSDMLSNPGRYFFISIIDGRATLCIRTCNSLGSDLKEHEVQGLQVDQGGDLISIFQDMNRRGIGLSPHNRDLFYSQTHELSSDKQLSIPEPVVISY